MDFFRDPPIAFLVDSDHFLDSGIHRDDDLESRDFLQTYQC